MSDMSVGGSNSSSEIAQNRNDQGVQDDQANSVFHANAQAPVTAAGGKQSDSIESAGGHKGGVSHGNVDPSNPFQSANAPPHLTPDVQVQSNAWFGGGANVGALVAMQKAMQDILKTDKQDIQVSTKQAIAQSTSSLKNAEDARERELQGAKQLSQSGNMALGTAIAGGVLSAGIATKQVSNFSKTSAEAKAGGTMTKDAAGKETITENADAWKKGEMRGQATTTMGGAMNTATGALSQNFTTQGQAQNQEAQAQSQLDRTAGQMQEGNAEKIRDAQKSSHDAAVSMVDALAQSASKVSDANAQVKI